MRHLLFVQLCAGEGFCVHARQHAEHILHRAHVLHLLQLVVEIGQRQLAGHHLFGGLSRLLLIKGLLRLLDQREHVAHAEDAGSHAVRVEGFDVAQLFARADELDRLAGDRFDRKRRAAARVAVHLGQQHAVDAERLVEGLRDRDRVLTGHCVHHEDDLGGFDRGLDVFQLVHELFVDMQAACGIEENQIVAVLFGKVDAVLCDLDRIALALVKHRDVQLLADHLELVDRRGAVYVARDEQRAPLLLLAQQACELGAVGGLARALQAGHHHDGGGIGRYGQAGRLSAEQGGQLLVDDLDDLLRRGQALEDLGIGRLFGDRLDEILGDLEVDVRLQKRHADLTHGLLDVGLGQPPLAAQVLESG